MEVLFWWTIFPYICGTILLVATFYRFVFRGKSWTAPSTEIFEKNGCEWHRLFFIMGLSLRL